LPGAPAAPRAAERAGQRRSHGCGAGRGPRRGPSRARRPPGCQRRGRVLLAVSPRPARKELGQHFLVDENLLGVIGRLAELGPDDVVLEIGPGRGVLTTYLADRVLQVHAVELDRSLEQTLRGALGDRDNVDLRFGDALELDLAALGP